MSTPESKVAIQRAVRMLINHYFLDNQQFIKYMKETPTHEYAKSSSYKHMKELTDIELVAHSANSLNDEEKAIMRDWLIQLHDELVIASVYEAPNFMNTPQLLAQSKAHHKLAIIFEAYTQLDPFVF